MAKSNEKMIKEYMGIITDFSYGIKKETKQKLLTDAREEFEKLKDGTEVQIRRCFIKHRDKVLDSPK